MNKNSFVFFYILQKNFISSSMLIFLKNFFLNQINFTADILNKWRNFHFTTLQ